MGSVRREPRVHTHCGSVRLATRPIIAQPTTRLSRSFRQKVTVIRATRTQLNHMKNRPLDNPCIAAHGDVNPAKEPCFVAKSA
ncbi:hypothetical protein FHS27_000245 [Rhodopirellula rubra]|uniref:Uncharacterized protein n=1 Tax=Aporhodopirellula rubra TaxID=980271 RepID=A0A7W5DTX2_9BACT|nr:hypothetical protein [Aporhodopirellula rubra]